MNVVIIEEKCPKNHKCPAIAVCPVGAVVQDKFNAPKIKEEICIRCGKCVMLCPKNALVINR